MIVCVFGPGLTILLLKTQVASFSTLCCSQRALAPLLRRRQVHEAMVEAGAAVGVVASAGSGHGSLGSHEADEHLGESVRRLMAQLSNASSLEEPPSAQMSSSGFCAGGATSGGAMAGAGSCTAMSEVLLPSSDGTPPDAHGRRQRA